MEMAKPRSQQEIDAIIRVTGLKWGKQMFTGLALVPYMTRPIRRLEIFTAEYYFLLLFSVVHFNFSGAFCGIRVHLRLAKCNVTPRRAF